MKSNCKFCGKKARRYCVSLDDSICSKCCWTKRNNEVNCNNSCEYLWWEDVRMEREIEKLVKSTFKSEEDDIFQNNPESITVASWLESFFISYNWEVDVLYDEKIKSGLIKLYAFVSWLRNSLTPDNDFEKSMIQMWKVIESWSAKEISTEIKWLAILRLLHSIDSFTWWVLWSKWYITMIGNMFDRS